MKHTIDINGTRLWDSVHEMAQIGATAKGGVKRLAFSALDRTGRDLFIDQCIELNMEIRRDEIGNIFALMRGTQPDLPVVMVGSHLDSQPTGGKYDGAYGVLCGLEIARALVENGRKPTRSLELVNFANEEGARFAPPMMGSGVFAGKLNLETMLNTTDFDGITIRSELANDTTSNFPQRPNQPIAAYFEAHIEQGPILEAAGLPIGIVTGAQAQRWYDVAVAGFESHAGPTPMTHRRDALLAAAEVALAVEQIARAESPDGRGTVGTLSLTPFSRNVVPGSATLTIDTRHPSDERLDAMRDQLRQACKTVATSRDVEIDLREFWHTPAMPFAPDLLDSLEQAAQQRGVPTQRLWSGAGHDAVHMAAMGVPTAMLFVQTKDGISHNESESIQKEHAVVGCQVLCDAVVAALTNEQATDKR